MRVTHKYIKEVSLMLIISTPYHLPINTATQVSNPTSLSCCTVRALPDVGHCVNTITF